MTNTILIIDDDEQIRNLLKQFFDRNGFEAVTASTAEEAIEMLENESYPICFIDFQLPGMRGDQLAVKIRAEKPATILFSITGMSTVFTLIRCREAGFDDYFSKPFKMSAILEAVKDAFKKIERWRSAT